MKTMRLQSELESLGGGNARISTVELHIIIDDLQGRSENQILWQLDGSVGLRDPFSSNLSTSKSMTYYPVTSSTTIATLLKKSDERKLLLHENVVKWTIDGFNSCIIASGARYTGKTLTLFGPNSATKSFPKPFVENLFDELFNYSIYNGSKVVIAISVWVLQGNLIIDLCEESATGKEPLDFAKIECPDRATAAQVLSSARAKCTAIHSHLPASKESENSESAHFFMRILIHRQDDDLTDSANSTGSVSQIHIVDLVGSSPVDYKDRYIPNVLLVFYLALVHIDLYTT